MKLITLKQLGLAGSMIAAIFVGAPALATTVTCADPLVSGQTRQYRTTDAVDCVWLASPANIGQGNPLNDDFLQGLGINDAAYGLVDINGGLAPGPEEFGLDWTRIDSQDYDEPNNTFPAIAGLTLSNLVGNSFDWVLTDGSYDYYALGLKDGGNPMAAIFLLDANGTNAGTAQIISNGGNWSHVVLYGAKDGGGGGANGNGNGVPEPATLALVGLGLLGVAAARRRLRI